MRYAILDLIKKGRSNIKLFEKFTLRFVSSAQMFSNGILGFCLLVLGLHTTLFFL